MQILHNAGFVKDVQLQHMQIRCDFQELRRQRKGEAQRKALIRKFGMEIPPGPVTVEKSFCILGEYYCLSEKTIENIIYSRPADNRNTYTYTLQ